MSISEQEEEKFPVPKRERSFSTSCSAEYSCQMVLAMTDASQSHRCDCGGVGTHSHLRSGDPDPLTRSRVVADAPNSALQMRREDSELEFGMKWICFTPAEVAGVNPSARRPSTATPEEDGAASGVVRPARLTFHLRSRGCTCEAAWSCGGFASHFDCTFQAKLTSCA